MKLRYHRSALADMDGIYDFIAGHNQAAAARTILRIRASIERLEDFPRVGRRGALPGTRELVISGLPFVVVYEVAAETVDIIAVFHAAEDRERGPA